jgi:tetratricopeptide (TPR) repeat protein
MKEEQNVDRPRMLNVRSAAIIFLAYFIAQIFLVILLSGIGGDRFDLLTDFLSPIVGFVVMVFVARALVPKSLKEVGPTGAAWVPGSWDGIMKGLVIGSFFGLGPLLMDRVYHPHLIHMHEMAEPIYHMVVTPGIQQLAAIVMLIFLAPVLEEMMFRGVLYGGCRKSLGPISAAIFTTAIFVAIHFPYYIYEPYKIICYIVIASVLLWCRLNWKAIGPAIVAHGGYNLIAVVIPSLMLTWQHSFYESGVAYCKALNFNQAVASFTHAIQLGDNSPSIYVCRGLAKFEINDLGGAISDYNKAIELNPKDSTAFCDRALAKDKNEELEGAMADYDEAIALNPKYIHAHENRAIVERELKQYDKAISDCDQAIKLSAGDYFAFLERGLSKAGKGNSEDAIADYLHAARLNPTNPYAFFELGRADCRLLNFNEAIACLTRAIELNPTNSIYYDARGRAECLKGDYDSSIADSTHAIQLDPNLNYGYGTRAWARYEKGDVSGAVEDGKTATRLEEKDSAAFSYDQGLLDFISKDYQKAVTDWQTTTGQEPDVQREIQPWIEKAQENAGTNSLNSSDNVNHPETTRNPSEPIAH